MFIYYYIFFYRFVNNIFGLALLKLFIILYSVS